MAGHWVLQGNPARWDDPHRLYAEPVLRWCVTGIESRVRVGDGVLLWMAGSDPHRRGIHAAGVVSGAPHRVIPEAKPSVALAIHWYVVHHPVAVAELRESGFGGHQILRMARRTAYPCTAQEFAAALDLLGSHGPTALPARPAAPARAWWPLG